MTELAEDMNTSVFDSIRGTRDALTVRRVFGEAYETAGVTIIPVARVAGGAGGGGGEGTDDEHNKGSGFGTGFGLGAVPVGVYEVRDGAVAWKPTVDVNLIAKGGQVLAGIVAVCIAVVAWSRR